MTFEEWARLPVLNLNLQTYPPLKQQIGGDPTYRDPTTEIARAAWHAGITSMAEEGNKLLTAELYDRLDRRNRRIDALESALKPFVVAFNRVAPTGVARSDAGDRIMETLKVERGACLIAREAAE